MISLYQVRQFLLKVSLATLISASIVFGFGAENSWATTSFAPAYQSASAPTQLAALNIEKKTEGILGKMAGESSHPSSPEGKVDQSEGGTQDLIVKSVDNPDYQPAGKSDKAPDVEATESLTEDAQNYMQEFFNKKPEAK